MRKLVGIGLTVYLVAALLGLRKEQRGSLTCGCGGGCWCKKAPLSLFRWVLPVGHCGVA